MALNTGSGPRVLVVEPDPVESVLLNSMSQNRSELRRLRIVHGGDSHVLPVAQHGNQHLDALVLKTLHVFVVTGRGRSRRFGFELMREFVVQVERRAHLTADRLLVDVGGEELDDIGVLRTVGQTVIPGVERIHVVGLDVNVDYRSFVSVSARYSGFGLCRIHLRHFGLLERAHHGSAKNN